MKDKRFVFWVSILLLMVSIETLCFAQSEDRRTEYIFGPRVGTTYIATQWECPSGKRA